MKKLALGLMVMVSVLSFGKMNNIEEEARLMAMSYENTTQIEGMTSEVAMGNDVIVIFLGFDSTKEAKSYFNKIEDGTIEYLGANPEETIGVKFDSSARKFQSRSIEDGKGIEVVRRGRDIAIIEVYNQNHNEIERARELVGNVL